MKTLRKKNVIEGVKSQGSVNALSASAILWSHWVYYRGVTSTHLWTSLFNKNPLYHTKHYLPITIPIIYSAWQSSPGSRSGRHYFYFTPYFQARTIILRRISQITFTILFYHKHNLNIHVYFLLDYMLVLQYKRTFFFSVLRKTCWFVFEKYEKELH